MDLEQILLRGSIPQLGARYRDGTLSVAEAIAWFLARIERIGCPGSALNAIRELSPHTMDEANRADRALRTNRALGPLHGIPVLLKDNILTHDGMTATAGIAALTGFRPDREAALVQRLRAAGAIIVGKTNMTELADYVSDVMPAGFSGAGGVVANPHGAAYGRGQGSSVGSAAAVAASLAMFAIGTETGNSIQAPAAYTSVVGYKPSVGVVGTSGIFPLVPSQDSPGPLTRNVHDAALVAAVLAGSTAAAHGIAAASRGAIETAALAGIRIGIPRLFIADRPEFEHLMPLFNASLSQLARAGATIVDPCDLPTASAVQNLRSSVFAVEFKPAFNHFLAEHGSPNGIQSLQGLIAWNAAHPESIPYGQSLLLASEATAGLADPAYRGDRARDIDFARTQGINAALSRHDVQVLAAPMGAASRFTGKAGAPVVTIPVGLDAAGVPFGISLFSSLGSDSMLLTIARDVESVIGARVLPRLPSH